MCDNTNSAMEEHMFRNKPWLRFITEPDGGSGGSGAGASGGGAGSGDPNVGGTENGGAAGAGDGGDGGDADQQLGAGGMKALRTEREARATAEQARDALQTEVETLRTQVQQFQDSTLTDEQRQQRDDEQSRTRGTQLETENVSLTLSNQRLTIALEEQVPADWAARIQGATPDEMREDAKKIKASLKGSTDDQHTPGVGHGGSDVLSTTPGMGTLRAAYSTPTRK